MPIDTPRAARERQERHHAGLSLQQVMTIFHYSEDQETKWITGPRSRSII
jgi:hypothetical protein